jgi:hypothetical protein
MTRRAAAVFGGLLAAMPPAAQAEDRPRIQPSRDVAVTYRVEGEAASAVPGGIPGALRLSWDAAGQRLRAEPEGRTQAVIVDLRAHSVQMMDTVLRSALTLPVREADLQPLTLDGARLTRRGDEVVAGLPCTDWAVQSPRGAGTVCLTADGVTLRAEGEVDGRRGAFTASSVSYGPQRDGLFRVPPEYMQFSMPKLGRVK